MKRKKVIKGIITVLLSAVMFLSALPVSAYVSYSTIFSLNLVKETNSEVVVSVNLKKDRFKELYFEVSSNTANLGRCKSIQIGNAVRKFTKEYVYDQSTEAQQFYFGSYDYFS